MRTWDEPKKRKAHIELIPMIDVMMFLLVFFVLVSLNVIPALGMKTQLPSASSSQQLKPQNKFILTLGLEGQLQLDGKDLTVEALVPAGKETAAVDAITAALPADTAWQPSGEARTAVGKDAAGGTVRPDAAPKDLAGSDAVPVTVVVVRDGTP